MKCEDEKLEKVEVLLQSTFSTLLFGIIHY